LLRAATLAVDLQTEEGWGGGDQNGWQEDQDGAGFNDDGSLQPLAAAPVEAVEEGLVPGKQRVDQLALLAKELHRVKLVSNGFIRREAECTKPRCIDADFHPNAPNSIHTVAYMHNEGG
jgi:hypothetical protein